MTTKTSWASLDNKPAKSKRGKTWDVDSSKAGAIYDQFTMFDRPQPRLGSAASDGDRDRDRYVQADSNPAQVKRLRAAATMVQTFVDALSGEQSNYSVGIDSESTTATTDLRNRVMKLPAQTILDPAITDQEASLLMVAFLGHEIGHIRLDDTIDKALQADKSVIEKGLYNSLSTILREARVEAGFSDMFPGYAGLFEPMLRWISRDTKDGSQPPKDALGFAVAATRYPFRFDWSKPEHRTEAEWWIKWVADYSRVEDYPGHKTALDLAHDHIKANLPPNPNKYGEQGQPDEAGSGQSQPSKTGGNSPYESASGGSQTDNELVFAKNKVRNDAWNAANALRQDARDGKIDRDKVYDMLAEIEKKAKTDKAALTRNKSAADKAQASIPASIEQVEVNRVKKKVRLGASSGDYTEAVASAQQANREMGLSGNGAPIRGAVETDPQPRGLGRVEADPEATGIFRSTFMRLRGGNDGRIGGKRSGRLDDRRIFRLADKRDDRVFTRRGAPKTQRLRVYLMVDTSGSMGGHPEAQIRAVSKSLIEASLGAENLSLEVWGWDNTVAKVWERGMDPDEVLRLRARGGTNDAASLQFAVERMQKNLRQDEHGLIIMMSDGSGQGNDLLRMRAEKARSLGMSVFGITMDERLDQTGAYGRDGFVQWQGSVAATALPLAKIISQSWQTKDQHRV